MPQSRRFKALRSRLATLREHFLPAEANFSPTGQYSHKQYDLAKAYVLLVHAEIEAYLEDRATDHAKKTAQKWTARQTRSKAVRRLLHFHSLTQPWLPMDWSADKVNAAINSYISKVSNNNGIKEKDVCHILFPLGIEYGTLNATWLANMNSFGAMRGSFAHGSIKTHQTIDPKDQIKKTKELLKGLAHVDRKITRLRS